MVERTFPESETVTKTRNKYIFIDLQYEDAIKVFKKRAHTHRRDEEYRFPSSSLPVQDGARARGQRCRWVGWAKKTGLTTFHGNCTQEATLLSGKLQNQRQNNESLQKVPACLQNGEQLVAGSRARPS